MNNPISLWGVSTPPSLVIFDLDGTLVNSLEDLAASINFMRREFCLDELTLEDVRLSIGKGARNLVARCMPENDGRIDTALKLFLEHNEKNLAVHSILYPGVIELLSALKQYSIPMAVVSNKNTSHSKLLLSALGIDDYFGEILGSDVVAQCKPFPDPLLEAISRTGADIETTIMTGDSCNDFDAASAVGIRSIGCRFGYGESWELERATVGINSLKELLPLPWCVQD